MQEEIVIFTDDFFPKAKSIEVKRLIYAVQLLIDEGKFRSFKSLAEKAGFSSQHFTDIKTGRKELQSDFLDKISNISSINKVWVLTGTGEKFTDVSLSKNRKAFQEADINKLLETIERKDRQIEELVTKKEHITIPENVWEKIEQLINTVTSQQRTIEQFIMREKNRPALREDDATCVAAS
ncbi:MAG: hypothetical protein LBP56_00160 [Odoribacteraceae bacterium]|jgi:hypothetical protein|nr:hypothetical protein [Odoribacteraceae bacterium]